MKNRELVEYLLENNLTISSCESMTGGMFAKYITDIPGTSACFDRSLVTYSNKAKHQELGVSEDTLEKTGAISEETAREMADGLYEASHCDVCISVTGNAGPDPAEGKAVGEYFVGIHLKEKTKVFRIQSEYTERNAIREDACSAMFNLLIKELSC